MALQSSGAISLNDIQNEFGGSNPISLSEYYGVASGIPSSGQISVSQFYGASSGPIIERVYRNNSESDVVMHTYYVYEHPYGGGGDSTYYWIYGSTSVTASYGYGPVQTNYFLESQTVVPPSSSVPWHQSGSANHIIKPTCPFPAFTHGGWYYYDLRNDPALGGGSDRYPGDVTLGTAYWHGNRTTNSSYPH